ncbi:MAG: putative cobaltochelatase [Syntrophales bacterium]|nr:putative cobaltochelatase [Syntrophales bacterium]
MTYKRPVFPFAALVDQERLKKALILNAINPLSGGVLIRGEKGTAKSTAARGLAELLPPIRMVKDCPFNCDPEAAEALCDACRSRLAGGQELAVRERPLPVVDLPLGTTEDRLLGTIDLEKAIKSGERHFEPGILAAANRGILYVDEVNLLDDHLVDVLLDAAAMGINVVEREGVSFVHPARFILVGTMNPEEGELRPQLLDRFGLCVEVTGLQDLEDRIAVVERWLAYEGDPEGFSNKWQPEQERLRQAILSARERLPRVHPADDLLPLISRICLDQGVDGHRADIYMLKVALALAAYYGREEAGPQEVRDAAELVLPHRLRRKPLSDRQLDLEKLEASLKQHQENRKHRTHTPTGDGSPKDTASSASQAPGMKEVVFAPAETFPVKPPDLPPDRTPKKAQGRRTQAPTEDKSGRYVRSTPSPRGAPDLALDATLRAAAPYQTLRSKGNLALAVAPPDVRHKVREKRIGHQILFVVDASGSMGARERMAETKAAILSLLLDAYQKRERVGLITFRGQKAELALPFTNSVETARKCLEHLPTGGKTPLPHALHLAYEVITREKLKHPQDAFLLVLITDGQANISLGDAPAIEETKKLARQLRTLNINTLVLDTEVHSPMIDFGCLPELSKIMGGQYCDIEDLQASEVVARIAEIRE